MCLKKFLQIFIMNINNNYHFIIRDLVKQFKNQFTCLGENTEKNITFTVPTYKEVIRVYQNGEEITKSISEEEGII